jgi:hypothetical protein
MIYLISPYTHPSGPVRAERSRKAGKAMLLLARQGIHAVSPVFFGHMLEDKFHESLPYDFWLQWSRQLMVGCRECYLLPLAGWRTSRGVAEECHLAVSLSLPITGFAIGEDEEEISGLDIRRQFDLPLARAQAMKNIFHSD